MSDRIQPKFYLSLALLLALCLGFLNQGQAWGSAAPTPEPLVSLPSSESSLYLPIIAKSYPPPLPVYGAETFDFSNWKLDAANTANIYWLRNATFSWAAIEPTRPNPDHTYNWSVVREEGLIEAANRNLTVVGIVKDTPAWARMPKYSNYACGPIDSSALEAYAQFVYDLVSIYSAPPYNIRYWEFGNEPDVDPALFGTWYNPPYGCWGDAQDAYYGGGHYAKMLKYIYPAVKSASYQSKVLIGGLLLYCDPTHPPAGETCLPAKFLEGILRYDNNRGASYFDVVTFHGYPEYYQGKIRDENHPNFAYRGGQLVGKVDFLRSVMANYGVQKPILMTEIALKCQTANECASPPSPPSDKFLELQADYIAQAYVRSWGLDLLGAIWYVLEESNWEQSGLFTGMQPRPAYNAMVFMTNELKDATIGAQITQYSGLRGYEFTAPAKRIWVLWAPDGVTGKSIPLPANVTAIYDKYGASITPTNPITVIHPTYFEFPR